MLRREKVTLLHIHLSGHIDQLPLIQWFARPYIVTLHAFSLRRWGKKSWLYRCHYRSLLRNAAAVTAVSPRLAQDATVAMPWLASRLHIVPNGIDISCDRESAAYRAPETARVTSAIRPARSSAQDGAEQLQRPYILSVGNLCFEKGMDALLLAYHDLLGEGFDADLVLCGLDCADGFMQDLARRLGLGRRCRFLGASGALPHEDVLRMMRECLFYVCPSREESFGLALMEAMACGRAVIASKTAGPSWYVRHKINGLLVDPGDVLALKSAMRTLAADAALRKKLEMRAPRVTRVFTWQNAMRRYSKTYELAVAGA